MKKISKTFCVLPFMHAAAGQRGGTCVSEAGSECLSRDVHHRVCAGLDARQTHASFGQTAGHVVATSADFILIEIRVGRAAVQRRFRRNRHARPGPAQKDMTEEVHEVGRASECVVWVFHAFRHEVHRSGLHVF